jgi:menaquinone-specific isochorismate synthase
MPINSTFWTSGAFVKPSKQELWLYEIDSSLEDIQKGEDAQTVSCMDFFAKQPQSYRILKKILQDPQAFQVLRSDFLGLSKADFKGSDRQGFSRSFQEIQRRIGQKGLRKAVPVVCSKTASLKVEKLGLRSQLMFKSLKHSAPLVPFGFWTDQGQGILGATPEILFRRKGLQVETMALAGTLAKSAHLQSQDIQDFLKDPKERHEHQLVIDDLQAQLSQLGKVSVGETGVLELPTLFHLWTPLKLELDHSGSDLELMQILHPTPALGVAPRSAGLDWMRDLPDQKDRGLFGGAILFPLGPDESLCLVMIRNLQWENDIYSVRVGCGIVGPSQEEKEWTELQNKTESVFRVLGIS